MRKTVAVILGALALSVWVGEGIAQDKKPAAPMKSVVKVLVENDKVTAMENTYAPGAESELSRSGVRVVRVLKGGTLQRTFEDGKKETVTYKTGQTVINEPGPAYRNKNIGKTTIVLYVVRLK